MNTFGQIFRLTSFGESHGPAIGGVIDGMPPGIDVDLNFIQSELNRRRPGQSQLTTQRKEKDKIEILSGIFEGKTTGCPIGFIVPNEDQHSQDYDNLRDVFRPSHADYTYQVKYGIRDHRGGGRSSARETISRVVAGAFAKLLLQHHGITITAYTSQVGHIKLDPTKNFTSPSSRLEIERNPVRCPDPETAQEMAQLISQVKDEGDTIGGTVTCIIQGCPAGLGEPVFDKLHARLAFAMLSINAAKGFEYGTGFQGIAQKGSQQNDLMGEGATFLTNNSGGIQGGISNGQDIYFKVAFKPVATICKEQPTINKNLKPTTLKAKGRHDPCVLPRAVPIVEAMAAIVIADFLLLKSTQNG